MSISVGSFDCWPAHSLNKTSLYRDLSDNIPMRDCYIVITLSICEKYKMQKTSGRPYRNTRLSKYVTTRILELRPRKTQFTIATEAGFANANVLSMIKNGTSKLPLDRVPGLAKALECDPAMLFTMAVEQVGGSTTEAVIKQIFGVLPTQNEIEWLMEIRSASDYSDPHLTLKGQRAIRGIFGR